MGATIFYEGGVQFKFTGLVHAENNAVGGTPTGLPSIPFEDFVKRVVIRVLGDTIYWTDDGSTPTVNHGFPLEKDETLVYDGAHLDRFKMISATTSDVRVIYYGEG